MTSHISKKLRTINDTCENINLPHTLLGLNENFLDEIATYLNFGSVISFSLASKRFRTIPIEYLKQSTYSIQSILNSCSLAGKMHLETLSNNMKKSFIKCCSKIEKLTLHGKSWYIDDRYHDPFPEKQQIEILSSTQSLQKLSLKHCSMQIMSLAASLRLVDFNLETNHPNIEFVVLLLQQNNNLQTLSFSTNNQESMNFFNYSSLEKPLEKLENLKIRVGKNVKEGDVWRRFVTNLPSLKKLEIIGTEIFLKEEDFTKLKTLEELVLSNPSKQLQYLKSAHSLKNLTVENLECVGGLEFLKKTLEELPNLTKVLFSFNSVSNNGIEFLADSGIGMLDKVKVQISLDDHSEINSIQNLTDWEFKHVWVIINYRFDSRNLDILDIQENFHLKDMQNLEQLEIVCNTSIDSGSDYHITDTSVTDREIYFLSCFDFLRKKITHIRDDHRFCWRDNLLSYLRKNPLMNCKTLSGYFIDENDNQILTSELLKIFPAVTTIDRQWQKRYALNV